MSTFLPPRYWIAAGDWNGFLALVIDNLSVLAFLAAALIGIFHFPADLLVTRMLPGTALGVLVGDVDLHLDGATPGPRRRDCDAARRRCADHDRHGPARTRPGVRRLQAAGHGRNRCGDGDLAARHGCDGRNGRAQVRAVVLRRRGAAPRAARRPARLDCRHCAGADGIFPAGGNPARAAGRLRRTRHRAVCAGRARADSGAHARRAVRRAGRDDPVLRARTVRICSDRAFTRRSRRSGISTCRGRRSASSTACATPCRTCR